MRDTTFFIETLRSIHRAEMAHTTIDTVRALRLVTNDVPDLVPNSDGDFDYGVANAQMRLAA